MCRKKPGREAPGSQLRPYISDCEHVLSVGKGLLGKESTGRKFLIERKAGSSTELTDVIAGQTGQSPSATPDLMSCDSKWPATTHLCFHP
jgi:hypothetical protein